MSALGELKLRVGLLIALACLVAACTSSHLYLKGIDPSDDRLALTGQVCTDDAQDADGDGVAPLPAAACDARGPGGRRAALS